MKMKKFTVIYWWYDLDCGFKRFDRKTFDNLEELIEWFHNQPANVRDLRISNIFKNSNINHVPYNGEGS